MKCGWYKTDDGGKVFIPYCSGSLYREDLLYCTCSPPPYIKPVKIKNMPFEPITITIDKFAYREISFNTEASTYLYSWCKKHKIKVDEPFNNEKECYDKMIIHIDTPEKAMIFQERWIKRLEKLAEKLK